MPYGLQGGGEPVSESDRVAVVVDGGLGEDRVEPRYVQE